MNEITLGAIIYLATLIDASGNISIYRYRRADDGNHIPVANKNDFGATFYTTNLQIQHNEPRLLKWVQDTFGGYVHHVKEGSKKLNRPQLSWRAKQQDIFELGSLALPYMFLKKREMEIMCKMRLTYINSSAHGGWGKGTSDAVQQQRDSYFMEFREEYEQRTKRASLWKKLT